ncbi:MFS transporter [Salmonella enterica subsp. enterica serovar Sandiego]|nr:MFS transporter [Salmonella enterica subsp. enterica serovar Sandiego]
MLIFFLYSQLITQLASAISGFSIIIILYNTANSVMSISLVYFYQVIPLLFFSQCCGKIVDRFNRKKLIFLAEIVSMLSLISLFFVIETKNNISICYFLISLISTCSFISGMSVVAMVSSVLNDSQRPVVNSLLNLVQLLPRLFGPFLAIFIINENSFSIIVLINVLLGIFSFVSLFLFPYCHHEIRKERISFFTDLLFFISIVKNRPQMCATLICVAVSSFMTGVIGTYIVPIGLFYNSLSGSAYALMLGGLGSIVGVSVLKKNEKRINLKSMHTIFFLSVIQIIATIILPIFSSMYSLFAMCFIFFLISPVIKGLSQSLWQSHTQNDSYGLIFSYKASALLFINLLSFISVGIFADYFLLRKQIISSLAHHLSPLQSGISMFGLLMLVILFSLIAYFIKHDLMNRNVRNEN